jgi:hypothetical protein
MHCVTYRKWSNQTKIQEFATTTIIVTTRSQYTTSVPTVVGSQRAGTKITEDLRSKQILELLTHGLQKAASEAELQTEACIHLDPCTARTMAMKLITKPMIAPSTSTPNGK